MFLLRGGQGLDLPPNHVKIFQGVLKYTGRQTNIAMKNPIILIHVDSKKMWIFMGYVSSGRVYWNNPSNAEVWVSTLSRHVTYVLFNFLSIKIKDTTHLMRSSYSRISHPPIAYKGAVFSKCKNKLSSTPAKLSKPKDPFVCRSFPKGIKPIQSYDLGMG